MPTLYVYNVRVESKDPEVHDKLKLIVITKNKSHAENLVGNYIITERQIRPKTVNIFMWGGKEDAPPLTVRTFNMNMKTNFPNQEGVYEV